MSFCGSVDDQRNPTYFYLTFRCNVTHRTGCPIFKNFQGSLEEITNVSWPASFSTYKVIKIHIRDIHTNKQGVVRPKRVRL